MNAPVAPATCLKTCAYDTVDRCLNDDSLAHDRLTHCPLHTTTIPAGAHISPMPIAWQQWIPPGVASHPLTRSSDCSRPNQHIQARADRARKSDRSPGAHCRGSPRRDIGLTASDAGVVGIERAPERGGIGRGGPVKVAGGEPAAPWEPAAAVFARHASTPAPTPAAARRVCRGAREPDWRRGSWISDAEGFARISSPILGQVTGRQEQKFRVSFDVDVGRRVLS